MDKNQPASRPGPMPVAFFGIAVGALALAGAWRAAARVWPVPHGVPDRFRARHARMPTGRAGESRARPRSS